MLKLLNSSIAPSTKAAYRQAYINYAKFHQTYFPGDMVLPINSLRMAKFVSYCALQGLKGTTIQTHVAGLNYIHNITGFASPSSHFLVKKMIHGSRKLTNKPDKRLPITITILNSLLRCIDHMSIPHYDKLLYKAMFLTAFFALLRVGEIASTILGSRNIILYQNVKFNLNKSRLSSVYITLHSYKHSQEHSSTLELKASHTALCPVSALWDFTEVRGNLMGPLFLTSQQMPISSIQFSSILRNCIVSLGLNPNLYTPHSLRIGGCCLGYKLNFSSQQLKSLGRWKSTAFTKYIRCPESL